MFLLWLRLKLCTNKKKANNKTLLFVFLSHHLDLHLGRSGYAYWYIYIIHGIKKTIQNFTLGTMSLSMYVYALNTHLTSSKPITNYSHIYVCIRCGNTGIALTFLGQSSGYGFVFLVKITQNPSLTTVTYMY